MGGEFREELKSGGSLVVGASSWCIVYYFEGPDKRYSGDVVTIQGSQIDAYIEAWKNNFEKYLKLKATIPVESNFETKGECGMSIRIGVLEGVCLKSVYMSVRSQNRLDSLVADYYYAKEKANKLMSILKTL